MKITYDPEVDALYIKLREGVARTERLTDDLAVDYDSNGVVVGIELLRAKHAAFADSNALEISFEKLVVAGDRQ